MFVAVKEEYVSLVKVLQSALDQAQDGKGNIRHSFGEPFDQQEICDGARKCGIGAMVYQARKKSLEALRLYETQGKEAALEDIYGAIIYLAASAIVLDEQDDHVLDEQDDQGGQNGDK